MEYRIQQQCRGREIQMIRAAVLGSPISHSLSPRIHTKAYEILGLAANYQAFEVTESDFASFFTKNMNEAWSGFSLTMPLKEVAFKVANEVDGRAKRINSANTLYRRDTSWFATSTDCLAFENLISLPMDSKVAIIGGGGTQGPRQGCSIPK